MKKVLVLLMLILGFNITAQTGRIITIDNDTIMTYGYTYKNFKNTTYFDSTNTSIKISNDNVKEFIYLDRNKNNSESKYAEINEVNKNTPGYHITKAGELQNKSLLATGIGLTISSGITYIGMTEGENIIMLIGAGAGLGSVIISIVYKVRANNHLKKAGKLMDE